MLRLFLVITILVSFADRAFCDPISNSVGIITNASTFVPPKSIQGQSSWLPVIQIRQETNLCVPTSAAMVLNFYGYSYPPREIKVWSRGKEYDPQSLFSDFSITFFSDLLSGLANHGFHWTKNLYPNDHAGFASGSMALKHELDQGRPVMVDTSLYTGHTFVIAGYDDSRSIFVAIDPFIAQPGLREISYDDFELIWNSSKVGSNIRATIFSSSQTGQ